MRGASRARYIESSYTTCPACLVCGDVLDDPDIAGATLLCSFRFTKGVDDAAWRSALRVCRSLRQVP